MVKNLKTLLLVEDDELLAMTETRWLSKAGYKIIHTSTGEKAIEFINAQKDEIDLILMDINLGSGIDGTEAAREILRMNDIPLLFLSSHTEKEVVEKTEKITSYGYVVKDSKDVVLLASINMAFKLFNANKALKAKEEDLLKSQTRLKRAEFISQAGNWELHLKSGTVIASEGALRVYGFGNLKLKISDIQKLVLPEYREELNTALQNLIDHDVQYNVKFKIKKADSGEIVDIHSTAEYDKKENVVFGVIKDITLHKIAEDAVKYERNLLRLLIDNIPDQIFFKDSGSLYLLNNAAHLRSMGALTQSEVIGKNPFDFFPEELAQEFWNEELELLKTGKAIYNKEEVRVNQETLENEFYITNKIPVLGHEGKVNGIIGISRNITNIKKHELVIQENEEKYRQLFESDLDALFLIETETGKILEANKAASALYGYSHDELLMLSDIDLSAEPRNTKMFNASNDSKRHLEIRINKRKDGTAFPAEIARSSFDFVNRKVHLASVRDITERKKVEQLLLESEQRWKSAIEGNNQGLWDWNLVSDEVYYSPLWKQMLGYEEKEIENNLNAWTNLVHPDDLPYVMKEVEKHVSGISQVYISEHRVKCKDGSYKWILDQGKILSYNESGKPLRMIGTHTDISNRKKTEEQLFEINEIFRLFIKYNPLYVFIKDSDIKPNYLSDNYEKMLNRPLDEILGKTMDELFPSELSKKMIEDDKRILSEGNYREFIEELDGRTYSSIKFPIFIDGEPKYLAGYTIDITERTKIEMELENQKRFFEQMYLQSATSTQILDKDGWCLRINPKLTELFGVEPEHIEGHIYNIFEDAEIKRNGIDKILRRVFDEHRIEQWEIYFDIGIAADSQNIEVKERKKKWYSNTAAPIVDGEGNLLYVVIQHEDITKRKLAEEQLKESEQIFAAAFHNSSSLISLTTMKDGIYIDVNDTFLKISGYSRDEVIGNSSKKLGLFENPQERDSITEELMRDGNISGRECRFRIKSGKIITTIISSAIINIKGEACLLSTVIDISERKMMEEGLRKFKMSIERSEDAIFITNEKGEIEYANSSFEKVYGFSPNEIIGKTPSILKSGLIPPSVYEEFWSRLLSNQAVIGEIKNKRKDGRVITVEGSNNPIMNDKGEIIGFLGIHRDISERKRDEAIQKVIYNVTAAVTTTKNVEELISITRDQLGTLMDTTNFYIAFYDEATDMLWTPYAKDEKDEIATWPAEKSVTGLVTKNKRSIIATRDDVLAMVKAGLIEMIGTPSEIWIGVPLKVDGKVIGAIVLQDYYDPNAFDSKSIEILEFISGQIGISLQRKQIEKTLQEKQNILSEAQRIAHIGSWNAVIENDKVSWSDETYNVFDVTPGVFEPSLNSILELIHQDDRNRFKESIEKQFNGEKEKGVEFRVKVRDNSMRYLSLTGAPTFDEIGVVNGAIGAVQDITERKESEAQLQRYMEELKAISATKDKFFSIISHDLKNPFHSINSALKIMMSERENMPEEERITFLQGILNTSNRAYLLLENLLLWSRNQMGQIEFMPEKIQLSEIILATIGLTKNSSSLKNITLCHNVSDEIFIIADRNMLETVLRNLLTNAIKFTNENGKIDISANAVDNQFVEISIVDNGIGIEPGNIEKLFKIDKPFSTQGTKSESGTGLGLILCKDFIERNGGKIWVESEFGKGSKFSFTLPIFTEN
ncbi:MAG: PAS domain S-box protein [Ignavibacteriales bacterium]|nr:PAS domain S-box protein [Ignavibacteriales bacterium]